MPTFYFISILSQSTCNTSILYDENTAKAGYHLPATFFVWCIGIYEKKIELKLV